MSQWFIHNAKKLSALLYNTVWIQSVWYMIPWLYWYASFLSGALHSQAFVQRAKEKVQACKVKPLRRSSSLPKQSQLCRDRSSPYETPEQSPKKASSCDSPNKSSISDSPSKSSISDSPSKSSMSDSPSKSSMYGKFVQKKNLRAGTK